MSARGSSRSFTAPALRAALLALTAAAAVCCAPAAAAQAAPTSGAQPATTPATTPAGAAAGATPPGAAAGATPRPGAGAAAAPSAEQVAIALADLAQGLKALTSEERADVVARNAGVADARVVKALAKYLKDKEKAPRLATLAALGVTDHADALKELHRVLSDEKLLADDELASAALLAIGRHHDASSLKVLGTDAWKNPSAGVARARLLAIANVRSKAAAAQLMDLMNTEPTLPWKSSPYMDDFRLALARLTGFDKGADKDAWRAWWREAEKTLKVAPEPPKLSTELQSRWDAFWALPEPAGKPKTDGAAPATGGAAPATGGSTAKDRRGA